jgi:hypothetical protein
MEKSYRRFQRWQPWRFLSLSEYIGRQKWHNLAGSTNSVNGFHWPVERVFAWDFFRECLDQGTSVSISKADQPVEKVLVEFVEEHMSLVEQQFTPRG